MPHVTQILVKKGDQVKAGQSLATVEAMQMETRSRATRRRCQVRESNGWPVAGRRRNHHGV
ncbi:MULTISPECIES: acetyl-CoA carboxylase biotin carboxyl carrier protein subunit [unclassified Sinorhizobium]|uniref:acetyl-CoA carboxylase biotin carboxyl carrier protein subunit n=1 Tax=unclassified Sinorhizobium TaxID=2613772 RepID=UPI0024C3226D|nr:MULTISPECIES: acetyl-CoA carboxylase biotin carboxyl carrier protein subunit [unclassified Sinorhizobium]MDK1378271.1 acetyl-CoA carboxylase biotin carboxyl carrier protein subunit [Sinorhizobium sp. 6-70]MDK1482380.1 acetyl-CoA carboxylase biotin carboxyl carrier protein subunit [Sinorhizobium sp. 6-117]